MALWGTLWDNYAQLYGDEMARQNHEYGPEDELRAGQEYMRRRGATTQPSGAQASPDPIAMMQYGLGGQQQSQPMQRGLGGIMQ